MRSAESEHPSCPQSLSGHPGGGRRGFPLEDCGNDELESRLELPGKAGAECNPYRIAGGQGVCTHLLLGCRTDVSRYGTRGAPRNVRKERPPMIRLTWLPDWQA